MKKNSWLDIVVVGLIMVIAVTVAISLGAGALMLLTGALHRSGLEQVPALSFRQSVLAWLMFILVAAPFRAERRNKDNNNLTIRLGRRY